LPRAIPGIDLEEEEEGGGAGLVWMNLKFLDCYLTSKEASVEVG